MRILRSIEASVSVSELEMEFQYIKVLKDLPPGTSFVTSTNNPVQFKHLFKKRLLKEYKYIMTKSYLLTKLSDLRWVSAVKCTHRWECEILRKISLYKSEVLLRWLSNVTTISPHLNISFSDRTGERAHWLRVSIALPDDTDLVPITYVAPYKLLQFQFPEIWYLLPNHCRPCTHMVTDTHSGKDSYQ